MNEDLTIGRISGPDAAAGVDDQGDILVECVEAGASVGFMLPLPRPKALAFWHGVAGAVERGERVLLLAQARGGQSVGTVQRVLAQPENQAHRADVAKMLVHRNARRRGVAHRLMSALEDAARAEGRTAPVLDTVTGGDAERLYQRAGWQRVGVVPDYARLPNGGYCAMTYFCKHL